MRSCFPLSQRRGLWRWRGGRGGILRELGVRRVRRRVRRRFGRRLGRRVGGWPVGFEVRSLRKEATKVKTQIWNWIFWNGNCVKSPWKPNNRIVSSIHRNQTQTLMVKMSTINRAHQNNPGCCTCKHEHVLQEVKLCKLLHSLSPGIWKHTVERGGGVKNLY